MNVSHIMCRYMAVFAGGFLIRKMVQNAMSLTSDDGVHIFTFPGDLDTKEFRRHFKEIVNNEIILTEPEVAVVLEESGRVFEMNNKLVATVQHTPSFHSARTNCLHFVAKGCVLALTLGTAAYAVLAAQPLRPSPLSA